MLATKKDIINRLQKNILQWQGISIPQAATTRFPGLEKLEATFPNSIFPTGAIHEFLTEEPESAAACGGFLSGILKVLMQPGGICLWINTSRSLFPPALKSFGINPDRIIFIDLKQKKDILWTVEEALKCSALAAVVGELEEISFAESRRLQLVVEKSRVTGFILRNNSKKLSTTACAARWSIKPLPSVLEDGMPGIGHPRWKVELLKVKNGNPGQWQIEWHGNKFVEVGTELNYIPEIKEIRLKAG